MCTEEKRRLTQVMCSMNFWSTKLSGILKSQIFSHLTFSFAGNMAFEFLSSFLSLLHLAYFHKCFLCVLLWLLPSLEFFAMINYWVLSANGFPLSSSHYWVLLLTYSAGPDARLHPKRVSCAHNQLFFQCAFWVNLAGKEFYTHFGGGRGV